MHISVYEIIICLWKSCRDILQKISEKVISSVLNLVTKLCFYCILSMGIVLRMKETNFFRFICLKTMHFIVAHNIFVQRPLMQPI